MTSAVLETDAHGTFVGSSYLYATARDWARFGQFCCRTASGTARRSCRPASWPGCARKRRPRRGIRQGPGLAGYGPEGETPADGPRIGFDLPDDTYWLEGHDGQSVAVIPSKQMVVVRMGLTPSNLNYRPQAMVGALVKLLAHISVTAISKRPNYVLQ